MNTKALREKRAALAKQAAEILAKAEAEKRNMSAEEAQTFDKIHADVDQLRADIDRSERQERLDAEMIQREERREPRETGEVTEEHRSMALRTWLLAGTDQELSTEAVETAKRCGLNPQAKSLTFSLAKRAPRTVAETRALGVGSGSIGAYTVPQGFMAKLEEALLAYGGVRQRATVMRTQTGAPLPWPTVNDTSNKGVLLAENTTVTSQDVAFGQVMLGAYKFSSKMVTLSVELLMDTGIDLENYLGSALGTRIGRIQSD
ncbi:MAG TPA: phage major capsid protein, partial [Pirellulales bacterium]|nr:phage major capsid protein [Pirellulales bacterium]